MMLVFLYNMNGRDLNEIWFKHFLFLNRGCRVSPLSRREKHVIDTK